ncbi:23S ribosomal RNA methyltransferase Erm, partial [Corynebacterium amycolatum]
PQPNVDGGILVIRRVGDPKIPIEQRKAFQAMVHTVFTARGRGIGEILRRAGLFSSRSETQSWLRSRGIDPATLPPRLRTSDWIDLFQVTGSSLPHHRRISQSGSSQRPPQRKKRGRRR